MATDYLYNTVFTNYAFNKLANNLANPSYPYSPYNFLTIKIGNGDNTINLDKTSLSRAMYTLNITNIKVSGSSITFTCIIPEDLEDVEITEIGLFDRFEGKDRLFSYSKVQAVKPSDLGYRLTIELNLTLRTVNFYPNLIKLVVEVHENATKEMLTALEDAFLWMEANLERIIDYNSQEVGKNLPQIYYNNEFHINNSLYGCAYANKYFAILNVFGDTLNNAFFIKDDGYLSYKIKDLNTDSALLNIYANTISSLGDNINFNSATTLSFVAKLGEFTNETTIINKKDANDAYFNLLVKGNILEFSLSANPRSITFTCELGREEINMLKNNFSSFIITFNGVLNFPLCHLYIDGVEKQITQETTPITSILDKSYIPLRNYDIDSTEPTFIETKNVVSINKEALGDEIYFLNYIQKFRNEENS